MADEFSTSPSGVSEASSTASIEINDLVFCNHGKEICEVCNSDFREDNDFTLGVDPSDRTGLEVDYMMNQKDNTPQCKKHKSAKCSTCFGFKKQVVKLSKDAAKAAKGNKKGGSNFD